MNHSSAPPSRRRQAERSEQTRARILDATLDCLAQYGYAGTGVAQVIAQAGVSRGAWSHHFASMNALIVAAAEHLMQRVYAHAIANGYRFYSYGDASLLLPGEKR